MHGCADLFLDDICSSVVDNEGALLHHLELPLPVDQPVRLMLRVVTKCTVQLTIYTVLCCLDIFGSSCDQETKLAAMPQSVNA